MDFALPLDQMTTAEKLQVLEQIWEDLSRNAQEIPCPSWHQDILQARDKRVQEGSAQFIDWHDAKQKIRDLNK